MNFAQECKIAEVANWPVECYKFLISKVLSGGILAGSVALKLPQIINIMTTKDVVGLSPESFYSEVSLSINTVLYNVRQGYPFLAYGETVMILIQNFLLVLLLWKFTKPAPSFSHIATILLVFAAITAISIFLPTEYLNLMPLANLPIMIYSRLVQIISNYRLGTTGQLSSITAFLILAGSLARVFTTIQDIGWDLSLLAGFGISALLSAILLGQVRKFI